MARVLTLTDAVVAIAMTLLVLPLVELADVVDTADLRQLVIDHADVLLCFGVSFVVIYVFWAAHGTAMRRLRAADVDMPALHRLNLGWLLVIAFLPFPTAVVGHDLTTSSAPLYIGTMFALSALTSLIVAAVGTATAGTGSGGLHWLTTAVLGACAVVSLLAADLGMLALLGLVPVRLAEVRAGRARTAPSTLPQPALHSEGAS